MLKGLAPHYLKVPRRTLMCQLKLVEPPYKLTTYGYRAFSVCAARLWNSIPLKIRQCNTVAVFKKKVKTYLFKQAF